jgi:hypothetical protein
MPPTASTATCPNCNTVLTPGSRQCRVCKLEVSKMAAFAAAKQAAQKRGIKTTAVETGQVPAWRSPANMIKVVCLLAFLGGLGWLGYHFFGPKPPRYLQFPATAQEAAQLFLTRVNGGDATYDSAYVLIADSVRSKKASDDRGDYVQIFHIVNEYLTAEFGQDWITQTKFAPDPADPNKIIAKVALETLHIRTAQQTPPDKMQQDGPHFGILGIEEVDVSYVGDLQQMAVIRDLIRAGAGQGALSNLDSIIGSNEANRHQPKFIKKMELLQVLRNPRATNWRVVLQSYPLRDDPVIKARLTAIVGDDRYDQTPRDKAKEVLADKVDESEMTGIGL